MFSNQRYITRGVIAEIPLELQLFMWDCIDTLPAERDYFQVFQLSSVNGFQKVKHFSEQPEYEKEYILYRYSYTISYRSVRLPDARRDVGQKNGKRAGGRTYFECGGGRTSFSLNQSRRCQYR